MFNFLFKLRVSNLNVHINYFILKMDLYSIIFWVPLTLEFMN